MATESPNQFSGPCVYPSGVYHRDFFLLRLPIKINGQPTVVKEEESYPVLCSSDLDKTVKLFDIAKEVSMVLATHQISLCHAFYDENYPLYAIDFPPPLTSEHVNSLLPSLNRVCHDVIESYFTAAKCDVHVALNFELHLCSPSKDGVAASKVTAIGVENVISDELIHTYLDSKMFKMSELFGSSALSVEHGTTDLQKIRSVSAQTTSEECWCPIDGIGHPSPTVHQSIFVLRIPIAINNYPTDITTVNDEMMIQCAELDVSVDIRSVVKVILPLLHKHGVFQSRSFHDNSSVLFEIDVPSQFASLKLFLSDRHEVKMELSTSIEKTFQESLPDTPVVVEADLELYHISSKAGAQSDPPRVNLVTLANISYYSRLQRESKLFDFSSSLFDTAHQNHQLGKDYEAEYVELRDIHKELTGVSMKWRPLAIQLDIPTHVRLTIQSDNPESTDDCLISMLEWWQKNGKPSWTKVVQALCIVNEKDWAWNISTKYNVPFPVENEECWIEERKERQMLSRKSQEAKEEVNQTKQSIDNILSEESELATRVKDLEEERQLLESQLENEQELCRVLNKCKEDYVKEKRFFKKRDETNLIKVRAIQEQIDEKEHNVQSLRGKLAVTEQAYENTKLRLRNLSDELAQKTSELEEKSSNLHAVEESQTDGDHSAEAEYQQLLESDELLLTAARQESQEAYLSVIERQLSCAQKEAEQKKEEVIQITTQVSSLDADVSRLSEKLKVDQIQLQRLKTRADSSEIEQVDETNENVLKLQISLTKTNIRLIDSRYQLILLNRKLKLSQQTCDRSTSKQNIKKSLIPNLSKCRVEGLNLPVHEVKVDNPLEFKVHLYDGDGQFCTGHHIVTVHGPNDETVIAKPDPTTQGMYILTYTPSLPGEQSLSISINDVPTNHGPFKILVLNTPHLPSCTVSGDGTTIAIKNRVTNVRVQLLDVAGRPVSSKQEVSACLSHQGEDCLALPLYTTTTELPGVYILTFLPRTSAKCDLTILVNGQPIARPTEVTVEDSYYTPLTGSASDGHLGFIQQLLDKGVDVNEKDKDGSTAIHHAAGGGHVDTVDLLVKNGAKVNSQNYISQTPLMYAAMYGHTTTVQTLILHHADIYAKDNLSQTALMLAAFNGHTTIVQTLVENGVDIHAKDRWSQTALGVARSRGHTEVVEYLKSVQQTIV